MKPYYSRITIGDATLQALQPDPPARDVMVLRVFINGQAVRSYSYQMQFSNKWGVNPRDVFGFEQMVERVIKELDL